MCFDLVDDLPNVDQMGFFQCCMNVSWTFESLILGQIWPRHSPQDSKNTECVFLTVEISQ